MKEIALTPTGERAAGEVQRTMTSPPAAIDRLTVAERRSLAASMAKVVSDDEVVADAFRIPPSRG